MTRALLPFHFIATHSARAALGRDLESVAAIAVKTLLKNFKTVEVAFQLIDYGPHTLAVSSRVTTRGELVLELDIGDPRLARHVILEDDYRAAERQSREDTRTLREAERRLRPRRW
ncbi:MAG: hypothetical protein ABL907_21195 [Hyphomicrobium sp.]